jgi:hypothetical protein
MDRRVAFILENVSKDPQQPTEIVWRVRRIRFV